MKKNKFLFLLTILICSSFANALTVGTYLSPPFSMREDGEDLGMITEVVRKILAEADIEDYKILEYPLARGLAELEQKRIDIFYPYITSSSAEKEEFIKIGPIARYRLALFVRKDINQNISLDTLHNQIVGVERGSVADILLSEQDMYLDQTSQQISCLKMVLAKRVTACASGELPGRYTAAINNIYDQFDVKDTDLYAEMYVLLGKSLPQPILDKITTSYEKLKKQNYFVAQQKEYEQKFDIFIKSLS